MGDISNAQICERCLLIKSGELYADEVILRVGFMVAGRYSILIAEENPTNLMVGKNTSLRIKIIANLLSWE